ncbi:MAG: Ceramidase-alk domain-containing protein [Shouchella clausii]|jgi:neutral ceramidase
MKVAYCKELINPEFPCHMEGYADRISNELHDNLEVNTLLIESNKTIIFHVLDVILIEKNLSDKIKGILSNKFSIPEDQIIIEATHTHSGPKVSTFLYPDITPSEEYLQVIIAAIVKNTEYCLEHKKEARAFYGTCEVNGFYGNRNNRSLPFNNEVYTLQFRNLSDKPLVSFINISCHPTVLSPEDRRISSDLIGVLRAEYMRLTEIPAIIVNGECGDVSTRFYRNGQDFAEVERVGKGITELLIQTSNFKEVSLENLSVLSYTLNIDHELNNDKILDESARKLLTLMRMSKDNPTAYVYEADGFRFVTIPGEIVYNLGKVLRSKDEKPMFINAYTNEFNGYAVDKEQYGKYYESIVSNYPIGKADEMIEGVIKLYRSIIN